MPKSHESLFFFGSLGTGLTKNIHFVLYITMHFSSGCCGSFLELRAVGHAEGARANTPPAQVWAPSEAHGSWPGGSKPRKKQQVIEGMVSDLPKPSSRMESHVDSSCCIRVFYLGQRLVQQIRGESHEKHMITSIVSHCRNSSSSSPQQQLHPPTQK